MATMIEVNDVVLEVGDFQEMLRNAKVGKTKGRVINAHRGDDGKIAWWYANLTCKIVAGPITIVQNEGWDCRSNGELFSQPPVSEDYYECSPSLVLVDKDTDEIDTEHWLRENVNFIDCNEARKYRKPETVFEHGADRFGRPNA